jgi:DNA-binding PadR family transcriptional regulator
MASRQVRHGVKYALLGLLHQYPRRYGYELAQRVEMMLGESAGIRPGLVYTSLDSLERNRLIKVVGERREGRRNPKQIYEVTDEGIEALTEWFRDHYFEPVRWDLPAKLALLRPERADDMLAAIDTADDECMALMRSLAERVAQVTGHPWQGPFVSLAYKFGSTQLDGRRLWLAEARETIEQQLEALREGRI